MSCTSQLPLRPRTARAKRGNSASRKNGMANTAENTSMPTSGQNTCPCVAATSSVPTKGMVQVNEVAVKAMPISSTPAGPLSSRERRSSPCTQEAGRARSNIPIRLRAKKAKKPATARFTHGLVANWLTPVAPSSSVSTSPSPV